MNERDQADKCSMSICSSIWDSFWESHSLKLWNLCWINFHYDWQLTMSNNSENIKAAFMISSNLIKKLKQDGISFTLNHLYCNYDNEIEEMDENYNNFYERYNKDKNSFISNSNLICGVYSMIKKMFDSQAYKIS